MSLGEKIFIIGGSGSLGNRIIERFTDKKIVCYSRDECKHWQMSLRYKSPNLSFIIGDIRDKKALTIALLREQPTSIIIAAALKHIDRCEYATTECINTNLIGTQNVLDIVELNHLALTKLTCVCFISTDKACSPVNAYGMAKALSETVMTEKSKFNSTIKYITVRYGNVLNSRGSIIPILHDKGNDPSCTEFILTHPDMTRFIMTLDDSIDLIEHAITNGTSGDIVIPELSSMKISDLLDIFSEKYNKPVKIGAIRSGEKILESLINETQSTRIQTNGKYTHIRPTYLASSPDYSIAKDYNSHINPLNKEQLKSVLIKHNLI